MMDPSFKGHELIFVGLKFRICRYNIKLVAKTPPKKHNTNLKARSVG